MYIILQSIILISDFFSFVLFVCLFVFLSTTNLGYMVYVRDSNKNIK